MRAIIPIIFPTLLLWCQIMFNIGCQLPPQPQEPHTPKHNPLLSDTTTCLSPTEQKILESSQKRAASHTDFLCQTKQLFYNLQQNNIETAHHHASDYGLGTFLYLDIEKIDSFMIEGFRINGNNATARIRLNNLKNPTTCYFTQKNDNLWVFNGIEAQGMRRAVMLK